MATSHVRLGKLITGRGSPAVTIASHLKPTSGGDYKPQQQFESVTSFIQALFPLQKRSAFLVTPSSPKWK